ncbi:MAG: preprotein translocase subunit SecG [Malacoplasma sp.]|nr:preprotein translocase subunit SecG [Mycoplasmataceae bacterium]MDD7685588.1 preprotein translocase subunit SecG [Mycoplasmataceae bacterium]MDY2887570.1 preprotein translocase subunit SecG [Malacoplasma sp.]
MDWATITLIVIGVIAIIVGLLLSSSGSTSGLSSMAGQDLELFKKTKDRGFIKVMQMVMFFLLLLSVVIIIVHRMIG